MTKIRSIGNSDNRSKPKLTDIILEVMNQYTKLFVLLRVCKSEPEMSSKCLVDTPKRNTDDSESTNSSNYSP